MVNRVKEIKLKRGMIIMGWLMNLLKTLWRGEVSLVKTYFVFAVFGHLLLSVLLRYVNVTGLIFSSPGGLLIGFILFILYSIYLPFIYICVWKSANNYTGPAIWRILAKIWTIGALLGYSNSCLNLFYMFWALLP